MATLTLNKAEMGDATRALNSVLLEEILGGKLPDGLLGIVEQPVTDWDGDEITMIYVVYTDDVDLDVYDVIPTIDYQLIYKYYNHPDHNKLIRVKSVNVSELETIF